MHSLGRLDENSSGAHGARRQHLRGQDRRARVEASGQGFSMWTSRICKPEARSFSQKQKPHSDLRDPKLSTATKPSFSSCGVNAVARS